MQLSVHFSLSLLAVNNNRYNNSAPNCTSSIAHMPHLIFKNCFTMIMWAMKSRRVFQTEWSVSLLVCKPCKDDCLMVYLCRAQENIYLPGSSTAEKQYNTQHIDQKLLTANNSGALWYPFKKPTTNNWFSTSSAKLLLHRLTRTFQQTQARCRFRSSEGQAQGYLGLLTRGAAPPWALHGGRTPAPQGLLGQGCGGAAWLDSRLDVGPRLSLSWPRSRRRPRSPRVPPGRRRAGPGRAASPSLWRPAHRLPPASAAPAPDWLRRPAPLSNSSRLSAMPRPPRSPIGPWAWL